MHIRPGPHKKCESKCMKSNCLAKQNEGGSCIQSSSIVSNQISRKQRNAQILNSRVSRRLGCLPSITTNNNSNNAPIVVFPLFNGGLNCPVSRTTFTYPRKVNNYGRYVGTNGFTNNPTKGGLVISNF